MSGSASHELPVTFLPRLHDAVAFARFRMLGVLEASEAGSAKLVGVLMSCAKLALIERRHTQLAILRPDTL